jgi:hypothetical protein
MHGMNGFKTAIKELLLGLIEQDLLSFAQRAQNVHMDRSSSIHVTVLNS